MATYIYETIPKGNATPQRFEYVQSMKDAPLTQHPETGEPVKRIVTGGYGFNAKGTKIDPFSEKAFREKTGDMKGCTLGQMFDYSKELSEARAQRLGIKDPVKQKYFDDYRKRKRGTPHTAELAEGQRDAKEHLEKGLKKLGISITPQIGQLGKVS